MAIERIVSGGQTGADQAALRAARAGGIATGGWAPLGWFTEAGPSPELLDGYGLVELSEPGYPARTGANVRDSDATVWFGTFPTPGFAATHDAALKLNRPFLIVYQFFTRPSEVATWVESKGVRVLNVAGNREGVNPGIGARVERFMLAVFRRLAGDRPPV